MKLAQANKDNGDLKYDNTLLYEKNVEKDEKLYSDLEYINSLKQQLDDA